jgi:polyhydroxybutyrate depolymerase
MIAFHGTADPLVPYTGGQPTGALAPTKFDPNAKPFPSVPGWAANWAARNRCGANPVETVVSPDVTRAEYTGCADAATVALYTVRGAGHQWPGGKPMPEWMVGPPSNGVDATSEMWAFFREHPLVTK